MGNRIAPAGGIRISFALLAFALVASLVQVVSIAPAQALANEEGPAPIPGASSLGLDTGQWETKNQHRIWFNESQGRWDAILPTTAGWQIAKAAVPETFGVGPVYGPVVGANNDAERPDVFWDESIDRLYVLQSGGSTTQFFALDYNSGADTYTVATGPIPLPGMAAGEARAAIYKTPNGDLWASVMDEGGLLVSRSINDGGAWSATPANLIVSVDEGQTQLTHFTDGSATYLGVAGAEDGDSELEGGRYSAYLFYKLDLTNANNFATFTRATGTLNISSPIVAGEQITIGGRVYTFRDAPLADAPGNVLIGPSITATRANLVSAINASGGAGYASSTLPHDEVTIGSFAGVTATLTAKDSVENGASIVTTETMAAAGNQFAAATMSGGVTPWSREPMNITIGSAVGAVVHADDELSLVTHDNLVYIATETQRTSPTTGGATSDPQVILFRRNLGGTWSQSALKLDQPSNELDRKRPVVAILDSNIYVMAADNDQTNIAYWVRPITGFPANPLAPWAAPQPLFATQFERHRTTIVPRGPLTTATHGGLPVLGDWPPRPSAEGGGGDYAIWQTMLPNTGNQAPGAFAGANKTVSASPATSLGASVTNDTLGGPVNWAWTVVAGPSGPGAGVNFTNGSGQCAVAACQLPTSAAFAGGLGVYVLRLTATESGVNPLTNIDDVSITVNSLVNAPPTLTVNNPKNGDKYSAGGLVTFSATATDGGANISNAIVWTSNRDGIIGFGGSFIKTNLSTGTHIIKANVTDGQNPVSSPNITITVGTGSPPPPPPPDPDNPFIDDNGHIFENAIEWLASKGITSGCNPPTNNRFCPNDPVTRGQMAAFLVRALNLPPYNGPDRFVDDNTSVFEGAIEKLAQAGITVGCNPPANNRFCPNDEVTHGQMAAFLVRAFDLPPYNGPDRFNDDNGHLFESAIERLAQAGITVGCNPPANNRFCPNTDVTRGQMAAFLKRAFGE